MNALAGVARLDFDRAERARIGSRVALAGKRALDLFCCLVAAPVALLIGIPVAIALGCEGGSVLFLQSRVGQDGTTFRCLKFRSMVHDAEERLQRLLATDPVAREQWTRYQKLSIDPRITSLGRFIRALSIDEVPQLVNVLRGDMSFVGPRPIMVDQIELYGDTFPLYCAMKPGLTGLWQINGRNGKTFADRAKLDAEYARTWSLWRDIVILVRTVPVVLAARGR